MRKHKWGRVRVLSIFLLSIVFLLGCNNTVSQTSLPSAINSQTVGPTPTIIPLPTVEQTATATVKPTMAPPVTDYSDLDENETLIGNTSGNIANEASTLISDDFDYDGFLGFYHDSLPTQIGEFFSQKGKQRVYQYGYDCVNRYGDWVFYTESGILKRMDIHGESVFSYGIDCDTINVTSNWIYYRNTDIPSDEFGSIYRVSFDGKVKQKLVVGINAGDIVVYKGWVYYTDVKNNFNLFRYSISSKTKEKLINKCCQYINIADDTLFFTDGGNDVGIYSTKVNDFRNITVLYQNHAWAVNIYNGYMYFCTDGDIKGPGIIRMNLKTKRTNFLFSGLVTWDLEITGDYIIFFNAYQESGEYYIMKTDGSTLKRFGGE